MAVDTPSIQYNAMMTAGSWDLCMDILGGILSMRAAGKTWLPKEPEEKESKYKVRLKRSFLNNVYKDTIEKYVARPFSRPARWDVKGNDEAKEALAPVMDDMDGEGQHHQAFSKSLFRMLLKWGVCTSFTDYPEIDDPDNVDKETEKNEKLKPINRVLGTPKVIGWETQEQRNGTEKIVEIRVKESYIEDTDNWEQVAYDQIRVIRADGWELWRREKRKKGSASSKEDEYKKVKSGTFVMAEKTPEDLPIVTAYTEKIAMMSALPPFLDLLWANLEDYQSRSDQKNILRFDRLGIIMGSGFTEEECKAGIKIAPTQAVMSENPEATLSRVETTGKPADNGWKDIHDIRERMEVLGMAPMITRLANVKATGIAANESKSRSQIESWIDEANLAMRKIMQLNLKWMGFDIPLDQIEYNIYQDFVFNTQQAQEVKDVIEARKLGAISHETFIEELQRYGRLSDKVDPEVEKQRVAAEKGNGLSLFDRGTPTPAQGQVGAEI